MRLDCYNAIVSNYLLDIEYLLSSKTTCNSSVSRFTPVFRPHSRSSSTSILLPVHIAIVYNYSHLCMNVHSPPGVLFSESGPHDRSRVRACALCNRLHSAPPTTVPPPSPTAPELPLKGCIQTLLVHRRDTGSVLYLCIWIVSVVLLAYCWRRRSTKKLYKMQGTTALSLELQCQPTFASEDHSIPDHRPDPEANRRLSSDIQFLILTQLREEAFDALSRSILPPHHPYRPNDRAPRSQWPNLSQSYPLVTSYHHMALACGFISVLYSHPILVSQRAIYHFRDAISHVPDLSKFVTGMTIILPPTYRKRDDVGLRSYVTYILQSCTPRNLVFIRRSITGTRSLSSGFIPLGVTQARLRILTICNLSPIQCTKAGIENFANLETLCLRMTRFGPGFDFPCMPRLRNLILHETTDWWHHARPSLLRYRSPLLESLYLYRNACCCFSHQEQPLLGFPMCQTMYLIGIAEVNAMGSFISVGTLTKLQHLTIGTIPSLQHRFVTWRPPHSLQSLTIFSDTPDAPEPAEIAYHWLTFNEVNIRTKTVPLSNLNISISFSPTAPRAITKDHPLVAQLEEICSSLGVRMSVNVVGK